MNQHFLEKCQVVLGFGPQNMAAGANNGDWVSMKGYARCAIVFVAGAGTGGEDPTITVEQATAVAGTGNKALNFTRVDTKQGADLTTIAQFTRVAQSAANTYTNGTSGEEKQIWVIDVKAEDLDIDGGFDCIQAKIADVGSTSKLGAILYFLHDPRYAADTMPGAIAN